MVLEDAKQLLSGSVAGVIQVVVGHPLDTIKVNCIKKDYSSTIQCTKDMIKENGYKSFYQGVKAPLFGSMFYKSTQLYTFEVIKKQLEVDSYKGIFMASCLTGVATSLVKSPIDMVKSQLQIDKTKHYFDTVKKLGIRGIYRGYDAMLIRHVPSTGLYLTSFDYIKDQYPDRPLFGSFLGGAVAGTLYWGATYPLDNYKTRMQTDHLDPEKRQYKNWLDCVRKTKFADTWRGFTPCIIRAVPVNSCMFMGYTYAKMVLKDKEVE